MIELDITFGKQDLTISQNGEVLKPNSEGVVDIKTKEPLINSVSVNGQNLPIDSAKNVNLVIMQDGNIIKPNADGSVDIKGGGGGGSSAVILWDENSDINNYTETGIYHFAGYRMTTNDHLPIDNAGEKNNISFTLIVDKSEGKFFESEQYHLKSGVSQTIIIDNNAGGDTKIYTRHGNITVAGASPEDIGVVTWDAHWQELVGGTYLGVIEHPGGYGLDGYNANEVLRGCTENGLYTGAFMAPPQIFDIFKLEVMNNYAMAQVYGTGNTVLQTLTILSTQGNDAIPTEGNGAHATLQRKGTWNGSAYKWTDWENQSPEVPTATQTTLGIAMGSSTVEVKEDGSLHVNTKELETAIADKIGVVKQGRNVLIEGDGSVNVDNVCYIEIDKNYSDGERNDIYVHFEPNRKLEDLKHEYNDIKSPGYTETEYKKELVPDDTDGSLCFTTTYLGGISPTSADVNEYIEPNGSYFTKGQTAYPVKDMYSLNNYVLCKMWDKLPSKINAKKNMLAREGYSNIQATPNFGAYPYGDGRWVVKVSIARANQYCHLSNIKLIDSDGKEIDSLYQVQGEDRVYGTKIPYEVLCDPDRFPFSIKADLSKYSFELNVSPVTSGDFIIDMEVYSEDSESWSKDSFTTINDTKYFLNWENAIRNHYGRDFKVSGQKTTTYPSIIETVDLTRNIAIAKDGILFQSAVKSGEGATLTATTQELYIKFDENGNIITNIGEFING